MARRRRRSKAGGLSFGALVILVGSLFLVARKAWPALAAFWLFIAVLWVAFFKPTQCDVETDAGTGCGNPDAAGCEPATWLSTRELRTTPCGR